jgi:hypothetical protein
MVIAIVSLSSSLVAPYFRAFLMCPSRHPLQCEAMEAAINKWANKLDRAYPEIMTCRVSIEAPSNKKQNGGLYHTRIDIKLPGKEIAVNRKPDLHHSYADAYVAFGIAYIEDFQAPDTRPAQSSGWARSLLLRRHGDARVLRGLGSLDGQPGGVG